MFYRRKVILALLQSFGGELDKISFQKLLLLFTELQKQQGIKPAFEFVPYQKGCFSFQSYADMGTMRKYGQVEESATGWQKKVKNDFIAALNPKDKQLLLYVKSQYAKHSAVDLIKHTYRKFPYYAIKSIIAKKVLTAEELNVVYSYVPKNDKTILYTIGYEGNSLEHYLNKLVLNDVKVLCDVRKNPLSMKYGFSKSQLQNACEKLGIKYVHIPDLGIDSEKRQNLETQKDYDKLFAEYERTTLRKNKTSVEKVFDILSEHKRIAVTCFEAHHCQCHRGRLANAVTQLPGWRYEVKHI